MAFVSTSLRGARLSKTAHPVCSQSTRHVVCANAKRSSDGRFKFPPDDSENKAKQFEPFDGSMPLLPPWRPPSVEADFAYNARRIVSRETGVAASPKKIVKVESDGCGTLFAELVQEVGGEEVDGEYVAEKMWLRPLLLDSDVGGTFVDMRGGTDLVLEADKVSEVDAEMRTRVWINLAATESDVLERAVSDERWNENASKVLLVFLKSI